MLRRTECAVGVMDPYSGRLHRPQPRAARKAITLDLVYCLPRLRAVAGFSDRPGYGPTGKSSASGLDRRRREDSERERIVKGAAKASPFDDHDPAVDPVVSTGSV